MSWSCCWKPDPHLLLRQQPQPLSHSAVQHRRFKSYSKYPPCYKDMAFWVSDAFTENNLCEVVRGIAGDLAEEVKLIDDFTHPKTVRDRGDGSNWLHCSDRSVTNIACHAIACPVAGTDQPLLSHCVPQHGAVADGRGGQRATGGSSQVIVLA